MNSPCTQNNLRCFRRATKSLLEKSGDLFTDLLDNNLQATDSETTIELNLAVFESKHTVKTGKRIKDKCGKLFGCVQNIV